MPDVTNGDNATNGDSVTDGDNATNRDTGLAGIRLVVLNNFAGPGMGGGEVQTLNVLRVAADAGMCVYLFCPHGAALGFAAREQGISVTEVEMRPRALVRHMGRLGRLVHELEPHLVQGTGFLTNIIVRSVAPESARVVNQVQVQPGASVLDGGSWLGAEFRRRLDTSARGRVNAHVAVSRTIADSLIASGVPAEDVRVIHAAIDPAAVRAAAGGALPVTFTSERPVVGVVARLEPVKGVEYFVRAAGRVRRVRDDVRFVVAGGGSLESKLREIAYAEAVSDRLAFLGEVRPSAAVLFACDAVVLPSLSEGLPVVALEAMALGKPVIASDAGGISEAVVDGETGVLVPPADPDALAAAILRLLDDPATMARMASAGRARVDELFTVDVMGRAYLRLYAELLEG